MHHARLAPGSPPLGCITPGGPWEMMQSASARRGCHSARRWAYAMCAFGMVAVTGPALVMNGTPLYVQTPSGQGAGRAGCSDQLAQGGHHGIHPFTRHPSLCPASSNSMCRPPELVTRCGAIFSNCFFRGFSCASGSASNLRSVITDGVVARTQREAQGAATFNA